ncbi:hypothetical protein [Rosenbergiella australiborealis]|uniref:hypothetical protein n=1 Tax=Rosenbergiella australiborealis TaxID=1544696 RepID=UPI001F4DCF01|nr:hypothetical protein [Rosenbergiella australiborealis]
MGFYQSWMETFREAKNEYRQKAIRYRDCEILRPNYVELAWSNRASQRECRIKMQQDYLVRE